MNVLSVIKQRLCYTFLFLFLFVVKGAVFGQQNPEAFLWAQSPTVAPNTDEGSSVAQEWGSTNFYAAGFFTGTITFGSTTLTSAGDEDIYLVKYACDGSVLWANSIGGALKDNTDLDKVAISTSGGGVYITGSVNSSVSVTFGGKSGTSISIPANIGQGNDIFLAHYNPNGNLYWAKTYGIGGECQETGTAVHGIATGGAVVTGRFCGMTTFGFSAQNNPVTLTSNGGYDAFVMVTHSSVSGTYFNTAWVSKIGGSQNDMGLDITCREGGQSVDIYVSGQYAQGGGNAIAYQPYSGVGSPVPYTTMLTNFGGSAAYVGRINSSMQANTFTWAWVNEMIVVNPVAVSGINAYIDFDYFDYKLYVAGNFDYQVNVTDNAAATASVSPSAIGNNDVYTTTYTPTGIFQWSPNRVVKLTNTTGSQEKVTSVRHDFNNGSMTYKIGGTFTGSTTFNGTTPLSATSAGGTDIYVSRLSEINGNLLGLWRAGKTGNETVGGMSNFIGSNNTFVTGKFENSTQIGLTSLSGTSEESYITYMSPDYLRIINTGGPNVPTASLSVDPVISSLYSGYSWYLNGVPLLVGGATYVPVVKGLYHVEGYDVNCPSRRYVSNAIFIGEDCTQGYKMNYPRNHKFYGTTVINGVNEIFEGNIRVMAGSMLTIRNSNILMRPCSKIIVEPGARLNIEHSTLFSCQQWKGIEVMRDGMIVTSLSSVIKDALVAIFADDAVVRVDQTSFINNKVSIALTNFNSLGALIQNSSFSDMYVAQPYCELTEDDAAYNYQTFNHYIDIRNNVVADNILVNTFTGVANAFTGIGDMRSIYIDETLKTNMEDNSFSGWMGTGVYITNGSGNISVVNSNDFTGAEVNIAIGVYESNHVEITDNNTFTGMENRAIEVKNSFKVTIAKGNEFNTVRGILLEKTLPYFVWSNIFNSCSYGVESYIDDFAPGYQTYPPPCVISENLFANNTYGVIVSPKMNPFVCPSPAQNDMLPGNTYQFVLVSCNTFDNNTYSYTTSGLVIDHYMGQDPANIFAPGGVSEWDILVDAYTVYFYSSTMPNTSTLNGPTTLNGMVVNSGTVSSSLSLIYSPVQYGDCSYDPTSSYPDSKTSSVQENSLEYTAYPNPAKETLNIEGVQGAVTYSVVDISGRQISTGILQAGAAFINVSNMAEGVYIVKLLDESGHLSVFKFIKANQ